MDPAPGGHLRRVRLFQAFAIISIYRIYVLGKQWLWIGDQIIVIYWMYLLYGMGGATDAHGQHKADHPGQAVPHEGG